MEFATELKACVLSLHAKLSPDSITNLMSDQVLVETPIVSAVGKKSLSQAFDYIQHPAYRGYQLDQIIEQEHTIRVLGHIKALTKASQQGNLSENTVSFSHLLLFLFDGPKTAEHLTHVILHTDFYSSPLFQQALAKTTPDDPKTLIKELSQTAANQFNDALTSKHLTLREIECLSLYIHSQSTKEIAPVLSVSHRTVETHINNILRKTGCVTKSKLFQLAHEKGCVPILYELQNKLLDHYQRGKTVLSPILR